MLAIVFRAEGVGAHSPSLIATAGGGVLPGRVKNTRQQPSEPRAADE